MIAPHNDAVAIPVERISELIGSIYDCVLNPGDWNAVLGSVCREFSFAGSILSVLGLRSGAMSFEASSGFDAESIASIATFGNDAVSLWGGYERIQRYPLGEPIVLSEAVGPAMRENRYYREWGVPRGLIDQIALAIVRNPSIVGTISFGRHESAGKIGRTEVDGLRLLAPHVCRAVTIGNLLDMKMIEAATFGSILDNFAFGIVLVDERLRVVHANAAAAAMLEAAHLIRSENGILSLAERTSHVALERAVHQAASYEAGLGAGALGIPVSGADGPPLVIHVLPLRRGEVRLGVTRRAAAALFIAPGATPPRVPTQALALLYDLTPAEARVLELLAAGTTQGAIARALGIAPSTVKSHVLHLFEKTGRRRQAELVRLVADVSLPV